MSINCDLIIFVVFFISFLCIMIFQHNSEHYVEYFDNTLTPIDTDGLKELRHTKLPQYSDQYIGTKFITTEHIDFIDVFGSTLP